MQFGHMKMRPGRPEVKKKYSLFGEYFCVSEIFVNFAHQNYKTKQTMTKADIVNEIAKSTGIEKGAVLEVVEQFMTTVKGSLADGECVYLRGFGSFILKRRAEKTARNISKNTTVIVPEHNIPFFKPAEVFKQEVAK